MLTDCLDGPKWNVNIFDDEKDKDALHKVIMKL